MKYPMLPASAARRISIPALDGGVNGGNAAGRKNNQLADCENLWWQGGALRSRPGLAVRPETATAEALPDQYEVYGGTDDALGRDGTICRKFVVITGESSSPQISKATLHTLFPDGRETKETIFTYPEGQYRFAFLADSGAGNWEGVQADGAIAFFLQTASVPKPKILAEPAEAGAAWVDVTERAYLPLIMLNGKSSSQKGGSAGGTVFEGANLLNPQFRALFTSGDGAYYCLPQKELDDTAVTVSLTLANGQTLRYTIPAGETASEAVSSYKACIDRTEGALYFVSSSQTSTPTALGDMGRLNNIEVVAAKTDAVRTRRLLRMRFGTWFGGGSSLYSGTRLFAAGNGESPGTVHWSGVNNPLYFPMYCSCTVGNAAQPVTAFARLREKLVIFKEHELYSVVYEQGSYSTEDLQNGTVIDVTTAAAAFPVSLLHPSAGCDCPRTIRLCENRLLWADSQGEVYCLSEANAFSDSTIRRLSQNVKPWLSQRTGAEKKTALAVDYAGRYILIAGGGAYCLNYTDDAFHRLVSSAYGDKSGASLTWYVWNLGEAVLDGSVSNGTSAAFLCRKSGADESGGTFLIRYASHFAGTRDGVVKRKTDGTPELSDTSVHCRLETGLYSLDPQEKRKTIRQMYLTLEGGSEITVAYRTDRDKVSDPQIVSTDISDGSETGRAFVHRFSSSLHGVRNWGLCLEGNGPMAVGGITVRYTLDSGAE